MQPLFCKSPAITYQHAWSELSETGLLWRLGNVFLTIILDHAGWPITGNRKQKMSDFLFKKWSRSLRKMKWHLGQTFHKAVCISAMQLLHIVIAYFIAKWDGQLLQIATAFYYKSDTIFCKLREDDYYQLRLTHACSLRHVFFFSLSLSVFVVSVFGDKLALELKCSGSLTVKQGVLQLSYRVGYS